MQRGQAGHPHGEEPCNRPPHVKSPQPRCLGRFRRRFHDPIKRVARLDRPIVSQTFECVVAEIKQEMPAPPRIPDRDPVHRLISKRIVANKLVKLAPAWGQFAITTLPAPPSLVIGSAESVATTAREAQDPTLLLGKLLVHECVQHELKQDVVALKPDKRHRTIWLGVPIKIKLPELKQPRSPIPRRLKSPPPRSRARRACASMTASASTARPSARPRAGASLPH